MAKRKANIVICCFLIFQLFGSEQRQGTYEVNSGGGGVCGGVSLPFVTSQRPECPELFFFFLLAPPVCTAGEARSKGFSCLVYSQARDQIFLENSGQVNSE